VVDWAVVMKALQSVGYDGALSVENFSGPRPTEEKLADDVKYLRGLEKSV
jgi:sugar phosphate isomerase/epimerase